MKRLLSALLALLLVLSLLPACAFAKAKQMNDGVPVWNEESVRQYVLDYVEGISMSRLWGYYDLQIRRYMPMTCFEAMLTNYEWLTGEFIGLGSYRSFSDPELQLKTHVIHLCMEKTDMDLYFTTKDKEDDWEVMALEFVPAAEELPQSESDEDMLVGATAELKYTETEVTVGKAPYELKGILTLPNTASAENPVPACVLLHDFAATDKDLTMGNTTFFADLAHALGNFGIASIRFDKRTYAYPDYVPETVWDEVGEDALFAADVLKSNVCIDSGKLVLAGLGQGGMLTPRIVSQSDGTFTAMILIGTSPKNILEFAYDQYGDTLSGETKEAIKNFVRKGASYKESAARELELFGHNGYYYWEACQYDAIKLIKKLKVPVYFVSGRKDPVVPDADGRQEYMEEFGNTDTYTFVGFRGLNHILMNDLAVNAEGVPEYNLDTSLDKITGRTIAQWILGIYAEE